MPAGIRAQPFDGQELSVAPINLAATGALIAGVAGTRIRVYKVFLSNTTLTTTLQFADGATPLTGVITLTGSSVLTLPMDGNPWFLCSTGNAFNLTLGASTQVSGLLWYTQSAFNLTSTP